jgi:hypothetical protein
MVPDIKKLILIILLIFPYPVFAGDYGLTVADDTNAPCTERARKIHEWCKSQRDKGLECRSDESWPIKTSDEVIESIEIYFSGGEPPIKILLAAFSNGHIEFCSQKERKKIYEALMAIKKRGIYEHSRHIDDFINILRIKH